MPRQMSVILPASEAHELIKTVGDVTGVTSVLHLPNAARSPAGDVVDLTMTHRALPGVMRIMDARGIGKRENTCITMSENTAEISSNSWSLLGNDPSEASFEEMETISGKESNSTRDTMVLMGLSGFIAAYGISTNSLHISVGAMLIAPGFVPLTRVALGIVTGRSSLLRGLRDSVKLYSVLVLGALVAALLIKASGKDPPVHCLPGAWRVGATVEHHQHASRIDKRRWEPVRCAADR